MVLQICSLHCFANKAVMLVIVLLYWLSLPQCLSYQLSSADNTQVWSSSSAPISLSSGLDLFYPFTASQDYSLLAWTRLPPSSQSFLSLSQATVPSLQLVKQSNGDYSATARTAAWTLVGGNISGDVARKWTHVAVVACSSDRELRISLSMWKLPASRTAIPASDVFVGFDPTVSVITYGGTPEGGEILDVQLQLSCLSASDIDNIVTAAGCHVTCQNSCFGPGNLACSSYIQLTNPFIPATVTPSSITWPLADLVFADHSLVSSDYSYTGWYYITAMSTVNNLFRASVTPQECCGNGSRVMALFIRSYHVELRFDNSASTQVSVDSPKSGFIGKWLFVSASVSSIKESYICHGLFEDINLQCTKTLFTGINYEWGANPASYLSIGHASYPGLTGLIVDNRYYPQTFLSGNTFESAYQQRKQFCVSDCQICSSPFECSLCQPGFVLRAEDPNHCYRMCPSGYNRAQGHCISATAVVLDLVLTSVMPIIRSAGGHSGVNGSTLAYYPPAFEPSDPIPSHRRGYYFRGGQYIQLFPLEGLTEEPLILSPSLTFTAWIRPLAAGSLYSKQIPSHNILTISLISSQIVVFWGTPEAVFRPLHQFTLDIWVLIGLTIDYDLSTKMTIITLYCDGIYTESASFNSVLLLDTNQFAPQKIGASALLSDYYSGFIWRIKVSNFISAADLGDLSASSCPLGLSYCLSLCSFEKTADCILCRTDCSDGCVRNTDCGLNMDPLCELSYDNMRENCYKCAQNAVNLTPCECKTGFYMDKISGKCELCNEECFQCVNEAYTSCISCYPHAELLNASCICEFGYFPAPHSGSCALCKAPCLSCSAEFICKSCKLHAYLQENDCLCEKRYYMSLEKECVNCAIGCERCEKAVCLECFSGYFYIGGACLPSCPSDYTENRGNGRCEPVSGLSEGLKASLEAIEAGSLLLNFTSQLANQLQKSDFALFISDYDGYEYKNYTYQLEVLVNYLDYTIIVAGLPNLPAKNQITIDFLSSIKDIYGNLLSNPQLTSSLHVIPSIIQPISSIYRANVSSSYSAATTSAISAGVAAALFSGNPLFLFSLINNVQILTYFPLSTVPIPSNLKALLVSINIQSFAINPFSYLIRENMGPKLPEFARNYGFSNALILQNAGVMVTTGAAFLCILPAFLLLKSVKWGGIGAFCGNFARKYRWNGVLRYWIEGYLDLSICAFLQVFAVSIVFSSLIEVICTIIALIITAISLLTPLALLFLNIKHRSLLSREEIRLIPQWQSLYAEFHTNKSCLNAFFYTFFIARRLIYALTLVLFPSFPAVQAGITMFHSGLVRQ